MRSHVSVSSRAARSKWGRLAASAILGVCFWLGAPQASWSRTHEIQGERAPGGLENFGKVSEQLFRGAQPSAAGFAALKSMGVGIVVNFRDERDEQSAEKSAVENMGIRYVGIPWSGSDNPSSAQVVQFLDLVRANPTAKIFVHCKRGADRTGVMVAAYRIAVEHKAVAEAVAEMDQFHYAHFWLPQLRRYVVALPQAMQADTVFTAYNAAPASGVPGGALAAAAATVAANSAVLVPAP